MNILLITFYVGFMVSEIPIVRIQLLSTIYIYAYIYIYIICNTNITKLL